MNTISPPLNESDLAAITAELEFEGDYSSPPEPDLTAFAKALEDVAHKAAVESNYDPHKVDAAIHEAERNAYYKDQPWRGLITQGGGVQPEVDPLVAPQGVGAGALVNAEIEVQLNAIHPKPIPYSEFDLTERFVRSRGDDFLFCDKDWRLFNGVGWTDGAEAKLMNAVQLHCKRARVMGTRDGSIDNKRALGIESGAMVRKIASLAQSKLHTKPEQWDADPFLLGTPTGVVDLKTGEFHRGRRDLIVIRTTVDPVSLPSGAFMDEYAPEFAKFLNWATRDDFDLMHYLQRAVGYTLTGDFSEQCLFFLLGPTNRGKGTWIRILHGILGPKYSRVADQRVFTQAKSGYERHSTELAALKGARMASFQETPETYTWDSNKLKAMTGGDDMTARLIAKDNTDFKPTFKFWFSSNNEPVVRLGDNALRRRLRLIKFDAELPVIVDTQLDDKLRREYPAILRWMIHGCLNWQRNGLSEPQVVTDAVKELFERGDVLDDWIDACCLTGSAYQAEKGRLFESWKAYADPLGEMKKYPSETMMGRGLESRGYKRGKATGNRRSTYSGIQPK